MPQTKAQILTDLKTRLDAAFIDPQITDKRHILQELADVTLASGISSNVEMVVPLPQTTLTIAAGTTASYFIDAGCNCLTICINSDSLVHYTEDGSTPTTANCWFAGGSKEIWDKQIPETATLRLLATSNASVSFQSRIRQ